MVENQTDKRLSSHCLPICLPKTSLHPGPASIPGTPPSLCSGGGQLHGAPGQAVRPLRALTGFKTLTSLNWGLHQHALPTGPGSPSKLGPGPSFSASATLQVCLSPVPSQPCLCLPMNPADPEPDLLTNIPSDCPLPRDLHSHQRAAPAPSYCQQTSSWLGHSHTWLDLSPASSPGICLMIWTLG